MKQRPAPQWGRIPEEMRARPQWLLASADSHGDLKVPTTLDAAGMPRAGSSTGRETWLTFETAAAAAWHYGLAIGYVVAADDPFVCIDLDVKNATNENDPAKWTPNDVVQGHGMIMGTFDSYTERSQSGQGLHIWVKGPNFGKGCKRNFVEVYCQERFLVTTGDVVLDKPIRDDAVAGEMVMALVERVRAEQKDSGIDLVEVESDWSDLEVVEMLTAQSNGDKYVDLCKGDWAGMGFPSQSEADLALLSMLCYKSKSNEQVRSLFRMTGLGKREKANKNDMYLNRTLRIIRGRQARELAAEEHGEQVASQLMQNIAALGAPVTDVAAPVQSPQQAAYSAAQPLATSALDWPPGLAGDIARFIYHSSPRPVREVAIVSALGLLAGIIGRGWNIPASGLNMYIVLIARSAVGKEAMHSGISKIVAQLSQHGPQGNTIQRFVDFANYASGPALMKSVAMKPSFVNIAGEWGHKLKAMAAEEGRTGGPLASLRTVMTDLYQKSAYGSIVGGMSYSDKEKNVASTTGVAYSMIGETTPSTFYESLTDSMMADGFLSRFVLIEYDGDRPQINYEPIERMDENLANRLMWVCADAVNLMENRGMCPVRVHPDAAQMQHAFNMECDMQINGSRNDEGYRQMWNRGHLKMMRLAALIAVADNQRDPWVMPVHVEWALSVVRNDITIMTRRMRDGDVGLTDHSREQKVQSYVSEYLSQDVPASYNVPQAMKMAGIVPRKYLQIRSQKSPAFVTYKMGSARALDDTIRSMVDSGYLMEIGREKLVNDYGFHGKAYRVLEVSRAYRL